MLFHYNLLTNEVRDTMEDERIRPTAFVIHEEKARQGIKSTPEQDWKDAKERLKKLEVR